MIDNHPVFLLLFFIGTLKSLKHTHTDSFLISFYLKIPHVTNIQTTLTYRRDVKALYILNKQQ